MSPAGLGTVQDGISITAYGQGQLAGATFTAAAHSVTKVEFNLKLQCVTPDNINNMDKLIRSMLSASQQESYDHLRTESSSGGSSFFGLFKHSSSSVTDTTHAMNSLGLTREQQDKIIGQMVKLANTWNDFKYKSKIENNKYDYSVSGNMFGIVMDATIQKDESHTQVRMLAPAVHFRGTGGEELPTLDPLFPPS